MNSAIYRSTLILTITTFIAFGMVGLEAQFGFHTPAGTKQVIILISTFMIWVKTSSKIHISRRYINVFLAALLSLLLPALVNSVPIFNIALGAFMTLEFTIIYIISKSSNLSFRALVQFLNTLIVILGLNAFFAVLNYAADFPAPMRHDAGLQGDAGFFASGLNLGIISLLALTNYRPNPARVVIAGVFTLIIFLTAIKKAIIVSLVIWIFWAFSGSMQKKIAKASFFSALLAIVSIISYDGIVNNIDQNVAYTAAVGLEGHVRFAMYAAAIDIARDNFPFGSGAGTFGSLSSITGQYSSFYDAYGISSIPTNSPEHLQNGTHTLLDTYWPHIVGETGFFGTLAIIALMFAPVHSAITHARVDGLSREARALVFIAILVPIDLAIEGFALYTPESPFFIVFLAGITGYSIGLLERQSARKHKFGFA